MMICQRCLKSLPDKPAGASVHTCTPSKLVRELEQQRDELLSILQDLREWNGDLVLMDYIDAAIANWRGNERAS